ncbi:NAD(P)H-dependent oxidoreductase subunit E [Qingshengfaniella alkalisoli]|uniref:NADH-quinone oxidoreductase subunit F n=1 Tax=Qingshengfaniella alkalisoli TaxID=2599296 RepID=A0A5B8I6I6_9RHOB|nr:NAD(P)H-dependent oxidoreductase subunit E [Qingshengfaniella alkalisoli]QDY69135.1 NADH-quinone oxidoreductase subunit F [Qingshengfaniella alkalisoli]
MTNVAQDKPWKSGRGKGRGTPKGRQLDDTAWAEVRVLLGGRPRQRALLIEFLHLIQDRYGHLSAAHLRALAEEMRLSMVEVYEVASFYAHFDVVKEGETPPPPLTIRVCESLSCELAGSGALFDKLTAETDPRRVRVVKAPCMGGCDKAPAALVGRMAVGNATVGELVRAAGNACRSPVLPPYETLDDYLADGGYQMLRRLRAAGSPDEVEQALLAAGLRGLGGAGFPSGKKWSFVRAEQGPRLMAVNGDEGEPGTFKDRYHLERVPHYCLEGMLIAAWAVEAERVYFYIRDEYPAVLEILRREIAALEQVGLIDPGYVELRRGAGAYICGEESAMLESIEGKRGIPRHRPPYVAQVGLFGRPTLVHNVETLHWIARICREGADVFAGVEQNGRKGLRSYSVSGRVAKPGVYLLPAGSTIRDVIDAAGGMTVGHRFKAYQPGGPSSGILPASLDHVPLDFDTLNEHGVFIGSAAVVVLSDRDNVKAAAQNMLRFFEHESCGQCTPCRSGCEKAVQLMAAEHWDQPLLGELAQVMADASICGLGQAAPNPFLTAMKYFPDEVRPATLPSSRTER